MSRAEYVEGFLFLSAVLGAALGAAGLVVRTRHDLAGAERVVAFGLVATAALVFADVAPLALGILSRGAVLAAAALALVAAAVLSRRMRRGDRSVVAEEPPPGPPEALVSRALGFIGAGVLGVVALASVLLAAGGPVTGADALSFHLPQLARWIQTGSLWHIDQFVPGLAHGNYPQNGDSITLVFVLAWRSVWAAHFAILPFYAMAGVAIYQIGRALGATAGISALAASAVLAVPIVRYASLADVLPDAIMYFTFAGGIGFLLRHSRTEARGDLVLAGLGLGLAFGTKWYALSSVVLVIAVWAAARLLSRRSPKVFLGETGTLAGLVLLAGGIWLVRNIVESANPFFPQKVAPLGVTLFAGPPDPIRVRAGFSLLHYVGSPHVWSAYLVPTLRLFLGISAAALLVGLVVALGLALRGRASGNRVDIGTIRAVAVAAVGLLIVYAATPFTAFGPAGRPFLAGVNSRYAVPGLILGAGLTAWAGSVLPPRVRVAFEALLAASVIVVLRRGPPTSAGTLLTAGVVAAIVLGAVVARRAAFGRVGLGLAALAAVAVVAVAGHRAEQHLDRTGYPGREPAIDWLVAHAQTRTTVGLAGVWDLAGVVPVLPSFGVRLRNQVEYIGPFRRHLLGQYHTAASFGAALRRARVHILVVGLGAPRRPSVPEEGWAGRAGYRLVSLDPRLAVFAAPSAGPLG